MKKDKTARRLLSVAASALLLTLASCTSTTPFDAGTVTSTHLYIHHVRISGQRLDRIDGYRCTVRPLFFTQNPVSLEKDGVYYALKKMTGGKAIAAEYVRGKVSYENRVLWSRMCVAFSAIPVIARNNTVSGKQ